MLFPDVSTCFVDGHFLCLVHVSCNCVLSTIIFTASQMSSIATGAMTLIHGPKRLFRNGDNAHAIPVHPSARAMRTPNNVSKAREVLLCARSLGRLMEFTPERKYTVSRSARKRQGEVSYHAGGRSGAYLAVQCAADHTELL